MKPYWEHDGTRLYQGHVLDVLKALPDESVQCVVTSPPYFGLRDYGNEPQVWGNVEGCQHEWGESILAGRSRGDNYASSGLNGIEAPGYRERMEQRVEAQSASATCARCSAWLGSLGLEPTPELFIAHLVEVFGEVKRVLRSDGTCWCNIGDAYGTGTTAPRQPGRRGIGDNTQAAQDAVPRAGGMAKQLLGMPWRLAFALQSDGWWLRSELTGCKVACMPESVTDRPTSATEKVFLFAKAERYYYDNIAVAEPAQSTHGSGNGYKRDARLTYDGRGNDEPYEPQPTRKMRNWFLWHPEPFRGQHYAVFPRKIPEMAILAGSSARGACARCGAAWKRVVERSGGAIGKGSWVDHSHDMSKGKVGNNTHVHSGSDAKTYKVETTGWTPTCTCGAPDGMSADDLEIVLSPTGERVGEDPTMQTGRKGLNRPRGEHEGQRPVTRYEQRRYATQLDNSAHRHLMEQEAGSAFAHYIRTDKTGARPIPPDLLESWLTKGWVTRVVVPTWEPPPIVPCVIMDPFAGSGTALQVAKDLGRHGWGIELNPEYCKLAVERLPQQAMVLEV